MAYWQNVHSCDPLSLIQKEKEKEKQQQQKQRQKQKQNKTKNKQTKTKQTKKKTKIQIKKQMCFWNETEKMMTLVHDSRDVSTVMATMTY